MIQRTFRHGRLLAGLIAVLLFAGIPSVAAPPAQEVVRVLDANLSAPMSAGGQIPVVVRFRSAPTAGDAAVMRAAGFVPPFIRYQVVPAVGAAGSAKAIMALAANPRVAYIEHDAVIPYTLNRATKAGRAQPVWDATYADAAGLHTGGITGRGVGIAIVDSGVDATHPDLLWKPLAVGGRPAKTVANFKMVGRDSAQLLNEDFVEANTLAIDMPHTDVSSGHGTHVAGIAGSLGSSSDGKYKGAAPGANIIGFGAGETLLVTMGLAAFDFIHQHHDDPDLNIRVVNNSWGGPGDYNLDRAVSQAAMRLVDDGLVVVFSAGNDGGDGSAIQTSVWANLPSDGIISVGNYYDGTGWVDSSSSRGLKSLERTWPDLSGPGTQIISTAATGAPVTYYGTVQDALIAGLEDYDEPVVVSMPAATPLTVEEEGVVVGPYASFTGTSMSAPFITGVVALMLEANPALTPAEVRTILRETATMPPGRSYAADGFAIGTGVVDAAEAVATALRATQVPVDEALGSAYANLGVSPAQLNVDPPRRLRINAPGHNDQISGSAIVDGDFIAGPVTDQTIPLMPPPASPVTGNPRIYQAGAIDPFLLGDHKLVAGSFVDLSVRSIASSDGTIVVSPSTVASASHRVTQDGQTVFGPFSATVSADGTSTQTNNEWSIPVDAPPGDYVFEGSVTLTNSSTYVTGRRSFSIVGPPAVGGAARVEGLDGPVTAASTLGDQTFFADDFESHTPSDSNGWTIDNNGLAHGLLTEWSLLNEETELSWAGPGDGDRAYAANLWISSPTLSGLMYTDLADTDLISPPVDLTDAATAELTYMAAGLSEKDFDFLKVYVAEDGSSQWAELAAHSGDLLAGGGGDWATQTVGLNAFVGKVVRIRFGFTSDGFSAAGNVAGWQVDGVRVTGTLGGGNVVIVPAFSATATTGAGSLDTVFSYSATAGTTPVDQYTLDFGDGSPVHTATEAGEIAHTFGPGQYTATLAVDAGGETETATLAIDVAPTGEVQVRIAGGPWVDAGPASTVDTPFQAVLDLTGLPAGPALIEARHIGSDGVLITATRMVEIV